VTDKTEPQITQIPGRFATDSPHHTASEEEMLANRVTIRLQGREILEQLAWDRGKAPRVTCRCGKRLSVLMAFRCFYCGVWFCKECAAEHFAGQEGGE